MASALQHGKISNHQTENSALTGDRLSGPRSTSRLRPGATWSFMPRSLQRDTGGRSAREASALNDRAVHDDGPCSHPTSKERGQRSVEGRRGDEIVEHASAGGDVRLESGDRTSASPPSSVSSMSADHFSALIQLSTFWGIPFISANVYRP
jgi:hypothetical protein